MEDKKQSELSLLKTQVRDLSLEKAKLAAIISEKDDALYRSNCAALLMSIFFRAACEVRGKNSDFDRFFSQTEYYDSASEIVDSFIATDRQRKDFFDYLATFQPKEDFLKNFSLLQSRRDEFFEFLIDVVGTGLMGGESAFPENYRVPQ